MLTIAAAALGDGWLATSKAILEEGNDAVWGGAPTRELALLTLVVEAPDSRDPVIEELGDPEWLDWMHRNFFVPGEVPELGRARSYASRLFDYGATGRDQIAWVVERLRADPEGRDATITTFEPLSDTTYVPCISLLDFWLRDGAVELVVYAHGLDFGKKAYGNLVELAHLQEHVGRELGAPVGRLVVHVKTAHVYEPEWTAMAELCGLAARAG
jgi:thymidylate synthase